MESRPAEHRKLSELEIKIIICNIEEDLRELKDELNDRFDDIEHQIYFLKRHFCPENFTEVKVSLKDLSDLVDTNYSHLGGTLKMERFDGMAKEE